MIVEEVAGKKKERVTVYDWVRVIAMVYVVIGHSAYLDMQTNLGGVAYNLPVDLSPAYNSGILSGIRWLAGWVYGFHMPLFFMLSGATIALRQLGTFDNILKSKVKRLLIPYFVYGWFFMFPIKRLGYFYDNASLKEALKAFLSGQESGHLWFLIALFWCILVFVVIVKLIEKVNIKSIYAILLITGIVQLLFPYIPFDILGLKIGLSYIFYFALGYVFEKERSKNSRWNLKTTISAGVLLLGLEIINVQYGVLDGFFTIIVGAFFTYIMAELCDRLFLRVPNTKAWNFIITNIFYVYLLHDPLNYIILRIFMSQNYLDSAIGCYMFTFFRTIVLFTVSLFGGAFVRFVKKKVNLIFGKIATEGRK